MALKTSVKEQPEKTAGMQMPPYYSELHLGKASDPSVQKQVRKETGGSLLPSVSLKKYWNEL